MNENPINEYKESEIATKEFLEQILHRSQENIVTLKKLEHDIGNGMTDEY